MLPALLSSARKMSALSSASSRAPVVALSHQGRCEVVEDRGHAPLVPELAQQLQALLVQGRRPRVIAQAPHRVGEVTQRERDLVRITQVARQA